MFNESFLRRVDCFKLSHQGAHISSHIEIAKLKRFASALAGDGGIADVVLDFDVDEQGVRHAAGTVSADVKVLCQRCLLPMDLQVSAEVDVAFVHDDAQAVHLPKQYEPVIVDDENCVDLLDVVEDDLLLALPLVTYHLEDACSGVSRYETGNDAYFKEDAQIEERANPFDVLEQLKKPRS